MMVHHIGRVPFLMVPCIIRSWTHTFSLTLSIRFMHLNMLSCISTIIDSDRLRICRLRRSRRRFIVNEIIHASSRFSNPKWKNLTSMVCWRRGQIYQVNELCVVFMQNDATNSEKNKAIFSSIVVKLTDINVWQHNCLVIGWPMAFKKYGRKICCNYFLVDIEKFFHFKLRLSSNL